jgi:hypothetical protein
MTLSNQLQDNPYYAVHGISTAIEIAEQKIANQPQAEACRSPLSLSSPSLSTASVDN